MTDYPSEARDSAAEISSPEECQEPDVAQAVTEPEISREPEGELPAEREEVADLEALGECSENPVAARQEKLAALEAVLFMAADPLPSAELAQILEVTPAVADQLAGELAALYSGRGIQVARVAGGYQIATRPEYGPFVAKLHKPERFRLSRAALETLAIVAYKQPITRPEIEAIRGVNSDSPVDTLSQYELICEAGRKEAPGRPLLYRTTDGFLGTFGLNSVADLPQLDSIPADEAAVRAEVAAHAGLAHGEEAAGDGNADAQPSGAGEEREEEAGQRPDLPPHDVPEEDQEQPA